MTSSAPIHGKVWTCRCGQSVFLRNSRCLACQAELGYWPQGARVSSLIPRGEGQWQLDVAPASGQWRRCANLDTAAACNWLVDDGQPFCMACRLNRTIPDLSVPGNPERWRKLELAKRRLIAQLLELGLPVQPRQGDAPGLAFDFLGVDALGRAPMTGHASGLVTLNIAEADDDHREQVRVSMNEPYRTVLGHLRHEVGHYYWERLVADSAWLEPFRQLFGDERASYAEALERHYREGAPADWSARHVSAYATMHPWEDWAETWAHYLHMLDALATAEGFGMNGLDHDLEYARFPAAALYRPEQPEFLELINAWLELTGMLNELSRSMGQADFYPFVISVPVVAKLQFIHLCVAAVGGRVDGLVRRVLDGPS